MNARPLRAVEPRREPIVTSLLRIVPSTLHGVAGEAPVRVPVPFAGPILVLILFAGTVAAGAAFGEVAVELLWLPAFVAAVILTGAEAGVAAVAAIVGTAALAGMAFSPLEAGRVVLDAVVVVAAALALRTVVVVTVASRTLHLRREAELAERFDAVLGIAERLATTHDREALLGAIVDEARRALSADATVLRIVRGGCLEVVAWAGIDDAAAGRLPVFGPGEGWYGEIARTGRPWVVEDAHRDQVGIAYDRYTGIYEFRGDIIVPLLRDGEMVGSLSAVTIEPRHWDPADIVFMTALGTQAAIAIQNAELLARAEARAGQLGVVQASSARLSRAGTVEEIGRAVVEETRGIIDYHNARVYILEAPDQVVPIAFEGAVGAYEQVDFALLRCRLGEGFTGWVAEHGTPMLVRDANADPRGQTIPGTDEVDESMLVVPMAYDGKVVGVITLSKLGLDQFDDDDLRLLLILADQAATALESARLLDRSRDLAGELRRLLDMSSQLSASLDSRQVASLIARHLTLALGVDECAISYWERPTQRVITLGYYPDLPPEELQPFFDVAGFPQTLRVLENQASVMIDADDPAADPAEVAILRPAGIRTLIMLPLVAKGQSIGLVELMSRSAIEIEPERLGLARTMANEAAMALENARLYEAARALADRDPLTGFYNHRFLHERFGAEVVRAQRARQPLSVLMLDLDDFKLVNDTFGHLFGDRVLAWTAELIRSTLRASDIPARYGGDEFAILLPDTDAAAAVHAAARIRAAFADAQFDGRDRSSVPVSLAIGVATFPTDGRSATDLIAAADAGLYREKRQRGPAPPRAQKRSRTPAPAGSAGRA
jgi:diguanylate cyclase (GGDEF)-like protein